MTLLDVSHHLLLIRLQRNLFTKRILTPLPREFLGLNLLTNMVRNIGLIVDLRLEVNPDGTVRTVDVADSSRMNSDPYYRAAAESAVRAVLNPRCRKLKLPPEKYDEWKILIIGFDPREMLGR